MREKRQKILIVEDEPILRQGLEVLGVTGYGKLPGLNWRILHTTAEKRWN